MATVQLELVRLEGELPEAVLTLDEDTGEISGTLAWLVMMASDAARDGYVVTHPYPTEYELSSEPLKSRRDIALVISTRWLVPALLRDAWPARDATTLQSDVDPVY